MDKKTEALKLALEAFEDAKKNHGLVYVTELCAIREALAEQCVCGEPDTPGTHRTDGPCLAEQPTSRPLSGYINAAGINANDSPHIVVEKLERAIEANLKEKNGHI